ncbi:MAG TPA: hydantoinase/oxoprolinase N-terminal domain-containing protein, partial [Candidatus Polarisedimenticolia bacterium]|nr:hydantoinase/oxoprolinase N-terminal domain-containing protein [Candidatus Polarisedimenticolia bacterium]
MLRVGIDTGGTFTDIVIVRGGAVEVWKEPSTPADPSAAILSGLLKALGGARPDHDALVVHGSTVATNALLEGKTARVAFVTNRGFEDLLEIGRQARPDLYNLGAERPAPLAPRELRFGVAGRLSAAAQELQPLDERELSDLAAALESLGVESAAVCLLHSYAEPSHERRAAAILAATGIPVSASCDLVPEHREYERASTAAVNAAVAPVMARYLERLAQALAPGAGRETAGPRLLVMGSNGGALSAAAAGREAV